MEAAIKRDGPYLYELFSVMVHQGCAAGGHYFAYIKFVVASLIASVYFQDTSYGNFFHH